MSFIGEAYQASWSKLADEVDASPIAPGAIVLEASSPE